MVVRVGGRGPGHSARTQGGVWTPARMGLDLVQWMYPTSRRVTLNGSAAKLVAAPKPWLDTYGQPLTASQPSWSSNRLVFDGSADFLESAAPYTFLYSKALPDSAHAALTGLGFTVTDIFRFPDGRYGLANFGKATSGASSFDASLVIMSADSFEEGGKPTILDEWPASNWSGWSGGMQGADYDDNDNKVIVACRDTQQIFVINATTGAKESALTIGFTPNGLTFDKTLDKYVAGSASSGDVSWINKSTAAVTKTFRLRTGVADQLYMNEADGSAGSLYCTFGANGAAGHLVKNDAATGTPLKQWLFAESTATEGVLITDNIVLGCNDTGYHGGEANKVNVFRIDSTTPSYGKRLGIAFTMKAASASQASTKTVLAGGDPTTAGLCGIGLYLTTTANQLRMTIRNTGSSTTVNWAVSDITTEAAYYLDIDVDAQTATLYRNGVMVETAKAIATISGDLLSLLWTVGASYEGAGAARYLAETVQQFVVTKSAAYKADLETYLSQAMAL